MVDQQRPRREGVSQEIRGEHNIPTLPLNGEGSEQIHILLCNEC